MCGLKGWMLDGKDTWIGATDAASLLRFLGFAATLVDFTSPSACAAQIAARKMLLEAQQTGNGTKHASMQESLHTLWAAAGSALHLLASFCCNRQLS
jgi:D-serine dehydratase